MKLDSVILAVEDQLGEAVSTRILKSFDIGIDAVIHEDGNQYLRKKAPELNRSANGMHVFLLTDSDTPQNCPPKLIRSWIKGSLNPRFLFRVAVMELNHGLWLIVKVLRISCPSHLTEFQAIQTPFPIPKCFLLHLPEKVKKEDCVRK